MYATHALPWFYANFKSYSPCSWTKWLLSSFRTHYQCLFTLLCDCFGRFTHIPTHHPIHLISPPHCHPFVRFFHSTSRHGVQADSVQTERKKERSKTHKRLKERFLIGRNRTKHANFRGSPLFQVCWLTTGHCWHVNLPRDTVGMLIYLVTLSVCWFNTKNWRHVDLPRDTVDMMIYHGTRLTCWFITGHCRYANLPRDAVGVLV